MTIGEFKYLAKKGWWFLAALLTLVFVWSAATVVAAQPEQAPAMGEHLVTIYDRGQEISLITGANTVEGALAEADIEVGAKDMVEPGVDSQLNAKQYSVNIYRARLVVIQDQSSSRSIVTAATSASSIAKQAELKLYDEDMVEFAPIEKVLMNGPGVNLTIDRATEFKFNLYGKTFTDRTQAETVGEMLELKGVKLGPKDGVTPKKSTPLKKDMTVHVWRNGAQTVTVEEKIKPEIEKVHDSSKPVGYEKVQQAGENGTKEVTYEIVMRDGKQVKKEQIASVVTKKPTKKIVVIGTKFEAQAISGSCSEWMAEAGVPNSAAANYLIDQESGCNPRAVNPTSGACGIGQSLPCSKMGPVNPDGTSAASPAEQMEWMHNYVIGRYGSWEAAAAYHRSNNWY